jgi:hypothetical protein
MNIILKIKLYLHNAWFQWKKKSLRRNIMHRYAKTSDPEVIQVLNYLVRNPLISLPMGMIPPYEWVKDYRIEDVEVIRDEARDLPYVTFRGYKVYFPREESDEEIRQAVRTSFMEQDKRSPHSYVTVNFDIEQGDVGVFIGASDGLFCLSLLDRLSRAYLFEPASHWIEPLKATFEPWADKVEIVSLAAGANSTKGQISLDEYFRDKALPNYIQVDVDGADWEVLQGAKSILKKAKKIRLSLCTYHKRLDFQKFSNYLKKLGYTIGHSPGFFLIGVRIPYLRYGVLYASKGNQP